MINYNYKYIVMLVILVFNILLSNTIPSVIQSNKYVSAATNMKLYLGFCRIQTLFPLILIPVLTFLIQETSKNTLFGSKYILLIIAIILNSLASILIPTLMVKDNRHLVSVSKLVVSLCKYPIGSSTIMLILLTLLIKQNND
jgi:hypothetical protein